MAAHRPDRREERGKGVKMPDRPTDARSFFPALAGIAVIAAYGAFFLRAESQAEVLGLVALAGAGVAALSRLGWSERVRESLAEHPAGSRAATAVALAAILALFCREHFPMLMLASVLLYTVACLGLTVQFGYAGVVNFAGAAFFGIGDSLILVSILILGGLGNPWGVALAASIVVVLPEKLQALQEYRLLFYAVLVIAILLFRPDGLLPRRAREYLPGWKPR